MIPEVLKLICSSQKLERDRGVGELQKLLQICSRSERLELEHHLVRLISDSESPWETKHGCLLGAKSVIPNVLIDDEQESEFLHRIKKDAEKLLTDVEVRVRMAAGEVLGALCAKCGSVVYRDCKDYVLHLIHTNLDRQIAEDDSSKLEQLETEKLMEKLAGPSQRRNSADAAQIFHDTAGWKNLETSLKCLQAMIEGCGTDFQPFIDEELLELIFETLTHTNRFVRETGCYVCAALVGCGTNVPDKGSHDTICENNPIYTFGHQLSQHLAKGLADNWSQVRLSASVATRKFLLNLPNDSVREVFYQELLPRMCLNRYYVAEGVRIYSQETWRQVTGSQGKDLVEKYLSSTVQYYILATESDNHAVREAACACIAELSAKIQPYALQPYLQQLLHTLLVCFEDDSWPVRDAACLACGNLIHYYGLDCRSALPSLYPNFFRNLGDPIPSVRQGAAASLGNVVRTFREEALPVVMENMMTGLRGIRNQPADSEKYPNLEKGPTQFSVVKRLRDNDLDLHSDRQMYSCGSLAPKMGRGAGCSAEHKFRRPSQPWEMVDGCMYLLAEMSHIVNHRIVLAVMQALPLVAEACQLHHYANHVVLLETVCRQLPVVARGIGSKLLKSIIEEFLDAIFYALECENALTSSAASQCLNQINSLLGPTMLRAKVQHHNPSYLHYLDANVFIAPF